MDTKTHEDTRTRTLQSVVAALKPDGWHSWAWDNYPVTIRALSRAFGLMHWCEIGGGRDPAFLRSEIERLGVRYTINDISQTELDAAPDFYAKARFDVASPREKMQSRAEAFDLMFSRMVFEHVHDVAAAWRNIHLLLKPGGVALAFFPTLYAPPFLINHLMPETLSRAIVHALYPARRTGGDDPKFPARYDWCFGSGAKLGPLLEKTGFSEHLVVPFWGTDYFARMPGLRQLDNGISRLSRAVDARLLTSHAYVLVRK
jgi:SAM-dependent methyltransferase